MKKILLVSFLIAAFSLTRVNAQIFNAGFENWAVDTAHFTGFGFFPAETFPFTDPVQWTSTNALSGADTFGHKTFVTQTSTKHSGSSAVQLTTDTLETVNTPLGNRTLTIPGLVLNGKFPLNLQNNVLAGGVISPEKIKGAGQPWSKRLATIKGFYDYTPVFNSILNHPDSCTIWAILRRGDVLVASAQFTSAANTGGYTAFSSNFQYVDCGAPDTLVILLAASIPNLGSVVTGQTDLVRGSVLRVDDLDFDTLATGFAYPPIARNDVDTTNKDVAKNVMVKLNDDDCDNALAGDALAVTVQPAHGTAVVVGTTHITYTPATGFVGVDSFTYTLSDGAGISTAKTKMVVLNPSGISETNEIPVTMYPVPASNELNIQFENSGKSTLRVYDMIGNLVLTSVMTQNTNTINVANLANGVYGIQISDNNNAVIARSKFTVNK